MTGAHLVVCVATLCNNGLDLIMKQQQPELKHVQVNNIEEEWEVKGTLHCQRQHNNLKYLVSWKGFGTKNNSWEPRSNLKIVSSG